MDTVKVDESNIEIKMLEDVLALPVQFESEAGIDSALELALEFLSTLPPVATITPWIVGSFKSDLSGQARSAKSHAQGLAIDISPMYSSESAMAEDKQMMGMAWNAASLSILACSTYRKTWWCVEGDHIHLSLVPSEGVVLPPGCVWSFPSTSGWYPSSETTFDASSPASRILSQPYLWSNRNASLFGPNMKPSVLAHVSVGDAFYGSIPKTGEGAIVSGTPLKEKLRKVAKYAALVSPVAGTALIVSNAAKSANKRRNCNK